MKTRAKEILEVGDRLFSARGSLMSLWQDIADNFYPERADFTTERSLGEEFGAHLMSSYPVQARRTLADQFGAMLRPRQKKWFEIAVSDDQANEDEGGKRWLERSTNIMRRAMYENAATFVRATSEGDHDFATFGQCVLEARMRADLTGLLYRCYHLRDVAWCENDEGKIDHVDRKMKHPAKLLFERFKDKCSDEIIKAADKDPYKEFECRHIVMPSAGWEFENGKRINKDRFPLVSFYVDVAGEKILEETPKKRLGYIIPRWKTLSGSQYAFSPATVTAMPDARLMQQMTLTLLEAGEKAVTPPMIAVQEAIRSDIDVMAGGITWTDIAYDERLGEVLRPISQQLEGIRYGVEMLRDVTKSLTDSFYLNKINLPPIGKDMTAFETQERVKEYIRAVLPLFEPMESDYNGQVCEETFELLLEQGAFGSHDDIPPAIAGQDIRFNFESPLQATANREKLEAFKEVAEVTGIAMQLDPGSKNEIDLRKAFRDAVGGTQAPADWLHDQDYVDQLDQFQAKQMQAAKAAAGAHQVAEIADKAGSAAAGFAKGAGPMPAPAAGGPPIPDFTKLAPPV